MPKYFAKELPEEQKELTLSEFVKLIGEQMMFGPDYYEYLFMLLGHGHKVTGTTHLFWMEWET